MSETYPRSESVATATPRNPLGWIVLFLLFAYLIVGATERSTAETPASRVARYTSELQSAIASKRAGENPFARLFSGDASPDAGLRKLERKSAPKHRTDAVDAVVWVTVRRQLGEKVEKADLAILAKDPNYRVIAEAYGDAKRTKPQALALAKRLDARGPASKIAADYVRAQAGFESRRESLAGVGLLAGLLFLSCAAWLVAIALGATGALRTLGPATPVRDPGAADNLALRAALLILIFVGLQTVAGLVVRATGLDSRFGSVFVYGAMIAAVPLVLRGGPGMRGVGLSLDGLKRNVGLGLWAFLLELPVTGLIAIVCSILLKNLPTPTHPSSSALTASPDLWTILVTFFGGAIVAPFWEETMFRGLLFPALRRVAGGPVVAALVSSFLFASIHPQGPVLWAALASVALFSCVLAQKSGSLVPSVVMHFAHNATLLTLTVLMGRS